MRHAFVVVLLGLLFAVVSAAQTPTDTQPVKKLVRTGTLGTCGYTPTEKEAPYYKQLDASERETGSFLKGYSIHGKDGKFVSWFGVVRGISKSPDAPNKLTLLLEQKYFDGMTDCHIMLVSAAGSGDFTAQLEADADSIPALSLVRVYGTVAEKKGESPVVAVKYFRLWPWFTFTFTYLGPENKGNPRWAEYCKLCEGDRSYNPYPTEDYYFGMLGDPKDFGMHLADWPK